MNSRRWQQKQAQATVHALAQQIHAVRQESERLAATHHEREFIALMATIGGDGCTVSTNCLTGKLMVFPTGNPWGGSLEIVPDVARDYLEQKDTLSQQNATACETARLENERKIDNLIVSYNLWRGALLASVARVLRVVWLRVVAISTCNTPKLPPLEQHPQISSNSPNTSK